MPGSLRVPVSYLQLLHLLWHRLFPTQKLYSNRAVRWIHQRAVPSKDLQRVPLAPIANNYIYNNYNYNHNDYHNNYHNNYNYNYNYNNSYNHYNLILQ